MTELGEKVTAAQTGATHLFSVGQAGYIIKSANGQLLGIDLYLSDCVEHLEGHMGFKRLLPKILQPDELTFDGLIATHPHLDHFDVGSMSALMSNSRTRLFASVNCSEVVAHLGIPENRVVYVEPGDTCIVGDFTLNFVNCDHGTGAPDAVGVVIEVDGKRIFEAGDTCLRLDRTAEYCGEGPLDVMIAPINGAYGNMNERECAKLSKALTPKITIPCHYGMFASHGGNPGAFLDAMKEICPGNKTLLMALGEELVL